MPMPMPRRRRWLFRLVTVFLALGVVLPLAELAIRICLTFCFHNRLNPSLRPPNDLKKEVALGKLMKADPDPQLLFRLWPGARACFRGARVEINAMGFRDDLVTTAKPPGTVRVLGLGDSSMFGFGVPHEETYLELLEAEFRNLLRGRAGVEFVNAGTPSYNSTQEARLFLTTGLKLDPDIVLIQFDANDPEVPLGYPLKPDFLFSRYLFLAHLPVIASGACFDCRAFYMLRQRDRLYDPQYPYAGWTAVREAYRAIAEACRRRNIPLLALLIFEDTPPITGKPKVDPTHKRILEIWRELGITAVEAFPAAQAQAIRNQQGWLAMVNSAYDPHPNPAGQALIAQAVLPRLEKLILERARVRPENLGQRGALGNILLRRITAVGLHETENWDDHEVNWSGPSGHFHFVAGGRRVVVPLMIGHPDASAEKPVRIEIRIDGIPTARHPDAARIVCIEAVRPGFMSQAIETGDLDGCPLEMTVSVDRTFTTEADPRTLGVGIYNLAFES